MKEPFIIIEVAKEELSELVRRAVQEAISTSPLLAKASSESLPVSEDETLTIQKASALLHLPVGTIRKKITCSKHPIPYSKPARSLLFRKSNLIQWQAEEEQIRHDRLLRRIEWRSGALKSKRKQ